MKKFLMMMLMILASITYANTSNIDVQRDFKYINNDTIVNTVNVGMPSTLRICEGDKFEIDIKSVLNDVNKIKYEFNGSTLDIWVDNMTHDDIYNLNEKETRITIMTPNKNMKVRTFDSNLQVTPNLFKKKDIASNGNN